MKNIEKGIVADDITEIRMTGAEYHWGAGYNEFTFACKIKGDDDILHMTEQRHDDGEGFVINSEKDDIWEHMTTGELFKLDDKLREEIEYAHYHEEIENAQTVDDCKNLMYEFMENDDMYFRKAAPRLWKELDDKEKKMLEAEKPSVIKQLKNDKPEYGEKKKTGPSRTEVVR